MRDSRGTYLRALPVLAAAILSVACTTAAVDAAHRPADWAVPVAVDGMANLYRVDTGLYRSRQPDAAALRRAHEQLGIRTVIDLRGFRHSDAAIAEAAGMRHEELGLDTWHVTDGEVVRVLRALRRRENGPFLLHCQHGADRTGLMVAMYRIVEQGWSKDEAIDEMEHGGYGFHPVWGNIVRYLRNVDVAKIRAQLDVPAAAPPGDNP